MKTTTVTKEVTKYVVQLGHTGRPILVTDSLDHARAYSERWDNGRGYTLVRVDFTDGTYLFI